MALKKRKAKKNVATRAKAKPAPKAKAKARVKPRKPAKRETPPPKPVRRTAAAKRRAPDPVDETSRESFPASDPPSWTPVTGEEK